MEFEPKEVTVWKVNSDGSRRSPVTGRFYKGHTPHNKGRKMSEYMSPEKIEKVKRVAVHNLVLRGNLVRDRRRRVIGVSGDGWTPVFESASAAADKYGLIRRNICHCCNGKRKHCGGMMWFYYDDLYEWLANQKIFRLRKVEQYHQEKNE